MGEEYEMTTVGDWNPELSFELQEAFALVNREVIRLEDRDTLPAPPIEAIGVVCGVLTMNDEIEILVRFADSMEQLVKTELCGDYLLLNDTGAPVSEH
uniref:hypothetical protein n=1 Tax=Marinobacterium profundum TaxID=1714300 RepID=UPI000835CB66|nr:hypothetical protein [Marinobacterium profundum]